MAQELKPAIGTIVHYFDPGLTRKIGRITGYGNRGVGPYAAIVANDDGEGVELFVFFPETPGHAIPKVPAKPAVDSEKHYWDWRTPLDKARAAKAADAKE